MVESQIWWLLVPKVCQKLLIICLFNNFVLGIVHSNQAALQGIDFFFCFYKKTSTDNQRIVRCLQLNEEQELLQKHTVSRLKFKVFDAGFNNCIFCSYPFHHEHINVCIIKNACWIIAIISDLTCCQSKTWQPVNVHLQNICFLVFLPCVSPCLCLHISVFHSCFPLQSLEYCLCTLIFVSLTIHLIL